MSTTSDLALLRRKLAATDYSPDVYVRWEGKNILNFFFS